MIERRSGDQTNSLHIRQIANGNPVKPALAPVRPPAVFDYQVRNRVGQVVADNQHGVVRHFVLLASVAGVNARAVKFQAAGDVVRGDDWSFGHFADQADDVLVDVEEAFELAEATGAGFG